MKNSKETCDHVLGYITSNGYDGDLITNFEHWENLTLGVIEELKSSDGILFNFCPNCGCNLKGLIEGKEESLTKEKNERIAEDKLKRDKADALFMDKVKSVSIQTKLNQLPDDGSFVVIFFPTTSSYGKDLVLTGPKDLILKNCVHYNQSKFNPDPLVVNKIYRAMTPSKLAEVLSSNGWEKKGESFLKNDGNKSKHLSYDKSGIVYINEMTEDSDGDVSNNYITISVHRLAEYLGSDSIELELIKLK